MAHSASHIRYDLSLDKEVVDYFVPGKLYRAKKDYSKLYYNKARTDGVPKVFWEKDDLIMLVQLELNEKWSAGDYSDPHGNLIQRFSFAGLLHDRMFMLNGMDEKILFKYFESIEGSSK